MWSSGYLQDSAAKKRKKKLRWKINSGVSKAMASPSSCGPYQSWVPLVCFVTLGKDKVMNVEDPEVSFHWTVKPCTFPLCASKYN